MCKATLRMVEAGKGPWCCALLSSIRSLRDFSPPYSMARHMLPSLASVNARYPSMTHTVLLLRGLWKPMFNPMLPNTCTPKSKSSVFGNRRKGPVFNPLYGISPYFAVSSTTLCSGFFHCSLVCTKTATNPLKFISTSCYWQQSPAVSLYLRVKYISLQDY